MAKTIIALVLALCVAFSFGCSKKKEPAKSETRVSKVENAGKVSPTFDPVSKEEVDLVSTPYSYEYEGVIYHFSSEKNMEAFKADPQKYLSEIDTGGE